MHRFIQLNPRANSLSLLRRPARVLSRSYSRDYVQGDKDVGEKTKLAEYDGPLVISGISGRFPNATSVKQLTIELIQGQELISETSSRWVDERLPQRTGFMNCLDKFDAGFFGMTPHQVHLIDPQTRLLLEVAFEAVIDAGLNPTGLRGSRTAVFTGGYGGEALTCFHLRHNRDAVGHQYSSHSFMIPARLAYHLDLRGPSSHVATACSSSLTALQTAVLCIQSGDCDAAIVTGSTVHLSTNSHFDLLALNALAKDGRCKAFDDSGDGFGRAEAAVAVVIQKEKDAMRNYAGILSIRSMTDGFKHAGIMHPSRDSQEKLLRECYAKARIDPAQVSYVEAHGTGTPSGDPEELHALHNVLCKGREPDRPLLVGSVKTNIGHTEGAAGLSGISKVIGAIQTGIIPPNLNFNTPNKDIEHLLDGSLKIVTEQTFFDRGIVGVSSFGIGGTNYHVVLQPGPVHEKQPSQHLPVLLPMSGRSEVQVGQSLEEASELAMNPEFVHLVHQAYQRHIPGHSHRGVALIQPNQPSGKVSVKWCETGNRGVWAIFPGMGSQHAEMGKALMKIHPYADSIRRSRATLLNVGLDMDKLLSAGNESLTTDIHHAFLAIIAVEMALWDTLSCLGIEPEGFIGHSFGEYMCAYADGCLSAEETLLLADARGRAFKESRKVVGGMASIALSPQDIKSRLPPMVELACFNAAQNVTISGELEAVTKFVEEIKAEGTMATMVNSCGFAAHSKYVQDAGELLKKYTTDIGIGNRPRSSRWISTSIPESEWDAPIAKHCSAEYFDGNVRNPVYFYQAAQCIPSGSLVIDVSPKGFFKALLSEIVPRDCIHVAPMMIKAENKLDHFFESVGQIYLSGVDVQMDKLYPAVSTPVSSNTPSLSHLVQWDHSKSWKTSVLDYPLGHKYESVLNLNQLNHMYLAGHKIEDRILVPATNILHNVWIQFAEMTGRNSEALPVQFTDVSFKRATILNENSETTLFYSINTSTGAFDVENKGEIVASGTISTLPQGYQWPDMPQVGSSPYVPLNKDDIYKAFRLRGYNYTGLFQGIEKIDNEGRWADVTWAGNWTALLDTVLQTSILTSTSDHLVVPVDIQQITIDPLEFYKNFKMGSTQTNENETVRVFNVVKKQKILTRGIEIKSLNTATVPRRIHTSNLAYESFTFCPLKQVSEQSVEYHFQELLDLVLENHPRSLPLNVVDIFTKKENSLAASFERIESLKPCKRSQLRMLTLSDQVELMDKKSIPGRLVVEAKENKEELIPDKMADLVLLDDPSLLSSFAGNLKGKSFVILHSSKQEDLDPLDQFSLVSQKELQGSTISLLRKKCEQDTGDIVHISVDKEGFTWLADLQKAIRDTDAKTCRIYLTSQGRPNSGILGLMRCLRTEDEGWNVRCIYDPQGELSLDFQQPDSRLESILQADLALNTWQDDQPGTYRHMALGDQALAKKEIVQDAYVSTLTPGDLSSLSWIQLPELDWNAESRPHSDSRDMKPYKVVCSALNFRDVLLATCTVPLLPQDSYKGQYLGFEFSGFDEEGNRVMGMTDGNGLASFVHADPNFVWPVPDHWTFEQAATVPVVYATVLHAFHGRAGIQAGQTVLIHAGSGGVGQAAIRVALAHGCKVFTTVGSAEKREFIKETFPQLTDEHIGCSRDTSFEEQFMECTDFRGADVILNSLAGEKLQASLRCLGRGGKFLEIGVFDAYNNTKIGMRPFLKGIDISGVELGHIMECAQGSSQVAALRKLMEDGIESGAVSPLPTHTFSSAEIQEAFRFMANGKHRGKLVIKLKDEKKTWKDPLNISAIKRSYFHPKKCYLVVGGLGGLGLELVSWLIERGARNLVITSRSGLTNGYQSYCMRKWLEAGADVQLVTIDLSDMNSAEDCILNLSKERKIGGVFNAALVLQDEPLMTQTIESFSQVSRPKEQVTLNLDKISRKHGLQLDYFVCFSSLACGRGSFDQSNYGWANSAIERICESRSKDGLHGLAIQFGLIGKVGFMSEVMKGKEMASTFEMLGAKSQSIESCLHVLDAALQQDIPVVSSLVVAEKGTAKEERAGILYQVEQIFGIDNIKSVDENKKLSELGMDSLVAVELRQVLEREFEITVTKEKLRLLTVGHIIAIADGAFDVKSIGQERDVSQVNVPWRIHDKALQLLTSHPSSRQVFIVHGSDGGSHLFGPLASRLKANVYAFQFTGQPKEEASIPELAQFYVQKLKEIQSEGPYTIMGYSAGATIAFTMAHQLKEGGDVVENLIFLDGCPSYNGGGTIDVKRLFLLRTIQSMNLIQDLTEDKMRALADSLTGDPENDSKQVLNVIKLPAGQKLDKNHAKMYAHLVISIGDYEPRGNYEGNVILLEAMEPSAHSGLVPSEDYELSKLCSGKVTRHRVTGSHLTFFEEEHLSDKANIINSLIEK